MSNLINEFGHRQDGRTRGQIRNISYRFGVAPQADGSVYYEQGSTKASISASFYLYRFITVD
jgi:ribonuclease PH